MCFGDFTCLTNKGTWLPGDTADRILRYGDILLNRLFGSGNEGLSFKSSCLSSSVKMKNITKWLNS